MGSNLSASVKLAVDTSADVFAPEDRTNDKILGIIWAAAVYIIIGIYCFFTLLGRWVEANSDRRRIECATVISRFFLSVVWPMTLLYLLVAEVFTRGDGEAPASYDHKMPL